MGTLCITFLGCNGGHKVPTLRCSALFWALVCVIGFSTPWVRWVSFLLLHHNITRPVDQSRKRCVETLKETPPGTLGRHKPQEPLGNQSLSYRA